MNKTDIKTDEILSECENNIRKNQRYSNSSDNSELHPLKMINPKENEVEKINYTILLLENINNVFGEN